MEFLFHCGDENLGPKVAKELNDPPEDATNLCSDLYCARSERNMRV